MSSNQIYKKSIAPNTNNSDWVVKTLKEVATFVNGKAFRQDELLTKGKYKVLRVGNFFTRGDWYHSDLELEEDKYVCSGDLMYAWSASFGPRFWRGEKTIYHYHIWKILPFEIINKQFLYYHLAYDTEKINNNKQGGTMFHITKSDMEKRIIRIPPLEEQRAIANLLGLFDISINTNDKIITQKEFQKKWMIQNLLTCKIRLRGFESGKCISINIGDTFEFIKSYSISREGLTKGELNNSIYCIHYGDIHSFYNTNFLNFSIQKEIPRIIEKAHPINERDYLKEGDLIIADASEDYEGIGKLVEVKNIDKNIAVGGLHTIVLRANTEIIANVFRGYIFSSEPVKNNLRKLATGTSVYCVTKTVLSNLSLTIPESLQEQKAIAQILQAIDNEIELLKLKTEKIKEQKKGMMHLLLTGKKRLKLA